MLRVSVCAAFLAAMLSGCGAVIDDHVRWTVIEVGHRDAHIETGSDIEIGSLTLLEGREVTQPAEDWVIVFGLDKNGEPHTKKIPSGPDHFGLKEGDHWCPCWSY